MKWWDWMPCMILVFWMLSFKPTFSLSSFPFIKALQYCAFCLKGGVICVSVVAIGQREDGMSRQSTKDNLRPEAMVFDALLLLLLLSHFSRVQLCVTPSLGFSRQEHWSGLPFPSPVHKSEKWKWSHSAMSDSSRPHGLQPTRLLRPWDFPGKSTGVGCHCLLRYDVLALYNITIRLSKLTECTIPKKSPTVNYGS